MSFEYCSQGFSIHPHRHLIEHMGREVRVRPKTFALLLLLLNHPREILTKRYLLETIWDDVAVDEQVLFQSIREIRQLFDNPDVIKTYPRKGYSWIAEVRQEPTQATSAPRRQPKLGKIGYAILFSVLLAVTGAVYKLLMGTDAHSLDGPVIVLPVKSHIPGNDHDWVHLGAMDQLIDMLASGEETVVMDTVYVLEAMRHAGLSRSYTTEQVSRMFEVSGGSLVVESELFGSVEDYRLDYRFHFRGAVKRGTIFAQSIDEIVMELSDAVGRHTGQTIPATDIGPDSDFNSELMSRALEQSGNGKPEMARSLLITLKQLEPNNVIARRLLARVLIDLGDFARAEQEIIAAIDVNRAVHKAESARLHFWLALAQMHQDRTNDALATLKQADALAESADDWLYRAYIAGLSGQIWQSLEQYSRAEAAYNDAIRFHGIIRCPIGDANNRLLLAGLYDAQGQEDIADGYYFQAKQIIETRELEALKPLLHNRAATRQNKDHRENVL